MENLRWKLVVVVLAIFLFSCLRNADKTTSQLDGHWYAAYGDSTKMYGEAIYRDGNACFYSDEFGLRYRGYRIKDGSILEIYNQNVIDNIRKLSFLSTDSMQQSVLESINVVSGVVNFYKITDNAISYEKLFMLDTVEQNKFIRGFMLRKAQWESRK